MYNKIGYSVNKDLTSRNFKLVIRSLNQFRGHIFNLGHGILPETSHENAITMVNDVYEISSRMDR